jgi:hypothetical protein
MCCPKDLLPAMMGPMTADDALTGAAVAFPISDPATGARSSTALARAVIDDALEGSSASAVDPVGADATRPDGGSWRTAYPARFRALLEAGLASPADALRIARQGLDSLHTRLGINLHSTRPARTEPLNATSVVGSAKAQRTVVLPEHGTLLSGTALERRLDDWLAAGVIEPSCAEAVRTVAAHPEWLDLSDLSFVLMGAGAQMGPLASLLTWGAEVIAVDLPRPALWARLHTAANASAGRMHMLTSDITADPDAVATWLQDRDLRGRSMVLGNYVYAPGGDHVLAAAAVDAITAHTMSTRDDVSLAFLGTPTDVYAVPTEIVTASRRAFSKTGPMRIARPGLRTMSRGRLAVPNYPAGGAEPGGGAAGIVDSLVLQQGANYAFAKRIQRWRASDAAASGVTVSFGVAPPSRTTSVVENRLLRAAYDGAHRFGVEIFDPATSNALMAVLLVHDLRNPTEYDHPWQREVDGAAHGGLWRQGYRPRSVLGMAVGFGARSLIASR